MTSSLLSADSLEKPKFRPTPIPTSTIKPELLTHFQPIETPKAVSKKVSSFSVVELKKLNSWDS
jgi:hypothetical protein